MTTMSKPALTALPINAPATTSWSASDTGLRTITPTTRRTIWTITHLFADGMGDLTAVVDGTLTRSAAIARAAAHIAPNDVVIATHSVVLR